MYKNKILIFIESLVVSYPTSNSLSLFWNLGSFLGFILVTQVFTGIILVFYFLPSTLEAFSTVDYISREVFGGFLFRILHLNGASFFFFFLYLHMGRGLFMQSFKLKKAWFTGVTIVLVIMGTAFLGYVLPWGQMSFWGATVITNFISTVPLCGEILVMWVWGGYNVGGPTLSFFFALHYLLPFVSIVLVLSHLIFLHETGSTNPLFLNDNYQKIFFSPFFTAKDFLNILVLFLMFAFICFFPWKLGDPENWSPANPLVSPVHIQPEWYFLFAYAILRCVPNKLGGVILLVLSVIFFYFYCLIYLPMSVPSNLYGFLMSSFVSIFLLLTWLGSCPVEDPYILLSQIGSLLYFLILVLMMLF